MERCVLTVHATMHRVISRALFKRTPPLSSGWIASLGAATFLGTAGWCTTEQLESTPARSSANLLLERTVVKEAVVAASIFESLGTSFSVLSPEYRRNVFFIYEKRLRVHSPPEKVFEYFSSVKSDEGTFMTSLDLMRAAVPVFQPVHSTHIRSGSLDGEHRDYGERDGGANHCPRSDFFKLFDTDGDGLISFPEYVFFITLLSLPESQVKSIFQQFDTDQSGELSRDEFISMMKVMRKSTIRGNATGFRTGLKATNVDNLSVGLVQYLFGDPDNEHGLSLRQFEAFLHRLRTEIDVLEFQHYDFTNSGYICIQDFAYSLVAGANVKRLQYFVQRAATMMASDIVDSQSRISKKEFMSFCQLLKHGNSEFLAKVQKFVNSGGKLSKDVFSKLAEDCGAHLSKTQIQVIFHLFDQNADDHLSLEELLEVVGRWE